MYRGIAGYHFQYGLWGSEKYPSPGWRLDPDYYVNNFIPPDYAVNVISDPNPINPISNQSSEGRLSPSRLSFCIRGCAAKGSRKKVLFNGPTTKPYPPPPLPRAYWPHFFCFFWGGGKFFKRFFAVSLS